MVTSQREDLAEISMPRRRVWEFVLKRIRLDHGGHRYFLHRVRSYSLTLASNSALLASFPLGSVSVRMVLVACLSRHVVYMSHEDRRKGWEEAKQASQQRTFTRRSRRWHLLS